MPMPMPHAFGPLGSIEKWPSLTNVGRSGQLRMQFLLHSGICALVDLRKVESQLQSDIS